MTCAPWLEVRHALCLALPVPCAFRESLGARALPVGMSVTGNWVSAVVFWA